MAVCLSYTAVANGDPAFVCELLQLRRTGVYHGMLDADIVGIELAGWYVIASNSMRFQNPDVLQLLSQKSMVLSCYLDEESMFSKLSMWKGGVRNWSVIHESAWGLELRIIGTLPPEIQRIADEAERTQFANSDATPLINYVFQVPVDAMDYYTSLRHDRCSPELNDRFETLQPTRVGFLQRLMQPFARRMD